MALELNYQRAGRYRRRLVLKIAAAAGFLALLLMIFAFRKPIVDWYTLRDMEHRCCNYKTNPASSMQIVPPVMLAYLDLMRAEDRMHIEPTAHLIFLHERKTANGKRELVVCVGEYLQSLPMTEPGILRIEIETVDLARKAIDWNNGYTMLLNSSTTNVVFGGQADPADPSHFTFRYSQDQGCGTVDAYLTDDKYRKVRMNVRDGPAADLQWHLDGG